MSATRSDSRGTDSFGADRANRLYQAGFDASWELDPFGGVQRANDAAQAELEAANADLHAVRVSLAAETALEYVNLRPLQEQLRIARRNLETQSDTARIAGWRATAGLASALDAEQAAAAREQTRARVAEPGQTVAAQVQAPVLSTLAENLTQMKLEVDVDEADVGQVHEGQDATFTVDAWPGREYPSHIIRVGFGSQEQEGVISYKTVMTVNNDDLSLRPGMTATAEIETDRRAGLLARAGRHRAGHDRLGGAGARHGPAVRVRARRVPAVVRVLGADRGGVRPQAEPALQRARSNTAN